MCDLTIGLPKYKFTNKCSHNKEASVAVGTSSPIETPRYARSHLLRITSVIA